MNYTEQMKKYDKQMKELKRKQNELRKAQAKKDAAEKKKMEIIRNAKLYEAVKDQMRVKKITDEMAINMDTMELRKALFG